MHLVTIRYGVLRFVADFKTALTNLRRGEAIIARTDRGTELGFVVSPPVQSETQVVVPKKVEPVRPSGGSANSPASTPTGGTAAPAAAEVAESSSSEALGEVLRRLTPEDQKELDIINRERIPKEIELAQKKIKDFNLPMKLASAEHILGGEKIIFYFLADGRVDFRELVKDLAREYKTRIELRQIGVRDKARLLGDYEHCGQELCCKAFLKDLEPVTMKMVKQQKTMMDPSKISGKCGRLMCCLRFEDETYTELKAKLPRKGSRIRTAKGLGDVVDLNVISQEVTMELEDGTKAKVTAAEIIEVIRGPILKVDEPKEEAGE